MAGARRFWTGLPVLAVLLGGATPLAFAQSDRTQFIVAQSGQTASLTGKLTDLHSAPLDGVPVILRNQATGAEARTTTARNGTYRFAGLEAGEYTLAAVSPQLGSGHVDGIVVAAGSEARVQSAMLLELPPPMPIRVVFHEIPTAAPVFAAILPAEPLRSMPLRGQPVPGLMRDPPTTAMPAMTAALPAQQLQALSFIGLWQNAPPATNQSPGLALSAVNPNALAFEHAPARPAPVGIPLVAAAAPDLALTQAAAGMVQAALLLGQFQLAAIRMQSFRVASGHVDPVTPVVTATVSAEQLQSLPASGRRWQDFVLDTPTAAAPVGDASRTFLRGAGQEPAETTIDGVSVRLAFGGQRIPERGSQNASEQDGVSQPWAGGHGLAMAESAIRQVETTAGNVEAEAERAAAGRMNVESQSGGNGLHGQGFLFDRQNTWGAQNPFTQWVKNTGTVASPVFTPEPYTPPDHEAVWGLGLGSQIRRDKLFWFAAIDSNRRNDPGLATVKHPDQFFAQPSNDQMQVLASRLELANANPLAEGLAAYSTMLETLDGLLGPAPRTSAQWVGFARIDWQAAERHRFTLEGVGASWNSPGGGLTRVSETYGSQSFGSSQASQQWLLGRWEAFLTPNLLAVTQGSAGRSIQSNRPETPSAFEQTLTQPFWGQLPQIVVDNRYGFTIGNPSRFGQGSYPDERVFQAQENVDWVRGGLLVKAGFGMSHNSDATSLLRNQTGTYTYSNVENFASDALVFGKYGLSGLFNPANPYSCDETGKVWRDSANNLRGLGYLPCYGHYSQTMGPASWHLSTNDWAGYATAQWQPAHLVVLSAGLRWEHEQLPPPIPSLANPELPLTERLPSMGNDWGPRIGLAVGSAEEHKFGWPVLRLGYGMYFGHTENATVETALTQTGSLNGDLSFFVRPTDGYNSFTGKSGAPLFPYVFQGEPLTIVKPGAAEFAPSFRDPEVHQAVAAIEETLPGHVQLTASALVSLGRRLPISVDTNFDPAVNPGTITYAVVDSTGAGPIKTPQITVPFYASWPAPVMPTGPCSQNSQPASGGTAGWLCTDYQQINQYMSRANSTYEAAVLRVSRYGRSGLSLHAHYTYAHAMDWNPNESPLDPDPAKFSQEYGTGNLDVRHSGAAMVIYEAPWKLRDLAGRLANGWMLSGIGQFRSGLPYTMRTSGALPEEFTTPGARIVGLGPGMNGSGGDNRVYGVGRNTYRYPPTWKADLRIGKSFNLGQMRQLELMAESFNLFNHQNVTELETTGYYIQSGTPDTLPTLNFLTGPITQTNGTILKPNTTEFGQPLNINATNFYRERQIQLGLRMRF